MLENEFGERIGEDTLRFERRFAAPLARVWNAIVTPEGLAVWLGRATVEPHPGGRFEIRFDDENRMDGRIVAFEPPRRLELAWHEISSGVASRHATRDDDVSSVTFELSSDEDDVTTLVFAHRYLRAGDQMSDFGAGWHAHLTALAALLHGNPSPDRDALYGRLREPYGSRLSEGAATS